MSLAATVQPARELQFLAADVSVERRPDASMVLRTEIPFEPTEALLHDYLRQWALARPHKTFLAERSAFLRQPAAKDDRSVTVAAIAARKAAKVRLPAGGMLGPYRNVMRMQVLIIFFGAAHLARLENFAVYAIVSAVYFFPGRLLRRPAAAPAAA